MNVDSDYRVRYVIVISSIAWIYLVLSVMIRLRSNCLPVLLEMPVEWIAIDMLKPGFYQ